VPIPLTQGAARELFEKIVTQAHHNGEPGVLFLDAANGQPGAAPYSLECKSLRARVEGPAKTAAWGR
jgi:hypothetical protein